MLILTILGQLLTLLLNLVWTFHNPCYHNLERVMKNNTNWKKILIWWQHASTILCTFNFQKNKHSLPSTSPMPNWPGTNLPSGRRPTYIRALTVSMWSAWVASVPVSYKNVFPAKFSHANVDSYFNGFFKFILYLVLKIFTNAMFLHQRD